MFSYEEIYERNLAARFTAAWVIGLSSRTAAAGYTKEEIINHSIARGFEQAKLFIEEMDKRFPKNG